MYIDTLSGLAHHVPLTQIDVPPAVYQYVLVAFMSLTKVLIALHQGELEARETDKSAHAYPCERVRRAARGADGM
jgi:hypothetical protein